jgi:hypothetical protein
LGLIVSLGFFLRFWEGIVQQHANGETRDSALIRHSKSCDLLAFSGISDLMNCRIVGVQSVTGFSMPAGLIPFYRFDKASQNGHALF